MSRVTNMSSPTPFSSKELTGFSSQGIEHLINLRIKLFRYSGDLNKPQGKRSMYAVRAEQIDKLIKVLEN